MSSLGPMSTKKRMRVYFFFMFLGGIALLLGLKYDQWF